LPLAVVISLPRLGKEAFSYPPITVQAGQRSTRAVAKLKQL